MQNLSNLIKEPQGLFGGSTELIFSFATAADDMPAWGVNPRARDIKLRAFWKTEPFLASSMFTIIAKYVGFSWSLNGPQRTCSIIQQRLHSSDRGKGMESLLSKSLQDYFNQDNGCFIEVARLDNSRPDSPFVQLNALDAERCYRTGRSDKPVIYKDLTGNLHELDWWSVLDITEMPAPNEMAKGAQICMVSRVLGYAQIMRDLLTYKHEKVSGRYHRSIHLVTGIQTRIIEDVLRLKEEEANNAGQLRYINPVVISGPDPNAHLSHVQIDLASLPDGFDLDTELRWYMNVLANGFGADYQDLAPLPGHNLGTAQQSQVLHQKGKGKGAALFMNTFANALNFHGVMPQNISFSFGEQDIAEQAAVAQLRKLRADTRKVMIDSGEITPEISQQMARDDGDLEEEYLVQMNNPDFTDKVNQPGSVK